ncbi:hypothetical protein [Leptospira noguchii]|uniref:Uncharacterized protein n=1 Tax=Leptospira noguchii TaxID=28182 RepID=A0A9Q8RPC9_9LEPT|nr:hypothetical protein [Leptospira noguchii]TQE63022.1 hypothetical protein FF021_20445 [Leptospira noguchii]UOG29145.1 hypothetical protein MAL06_10515 [Leptospira noguchii]UOG43803.1 hypothetical protein MAL01_09920 [Leptospira noguchii]UOG54154.1 hypothetical protein MAL09_08800 [Leptospira noguchii]UOG55287.1 hypothetical protein MAL03_10125 [Leptospira noguchii]
MKFASCDDDPGNSVNAYLWVGVQGVVALSLLFAPIFLRRTHVKITSNSGFLLMLRPKLIV